MTASERDLCQAKGPDPQTKSNTTHGVSQYLAQNAYEKGEHTLLQGVVHEAAENKTERLSRVLSLSGHCT